MEIEVNIPSERVFLSANNCNYFAYQADNDKQITTRFFFIAEEVEGE